MASFAAAEACRVTLPIDNWRNAVVEQKCADLLMVASLFCVFVLALARHRLAPHDLDQ